ncbi:acyl-CoA dehydrogenase family protein [Actinomadura rugatobispora]|uniref:Acyl-CoA dehydrogenase family protein n=1 Tax=Actinomadura rugatobispora TaxID=1994 RepID=A0ABW1AD38_9ACTN|nr:hypothetical protein GCM10010200_004260 [Actinomadura rugatobispora]
MDVSLTEELRLLAESVASLARRHATTGGHRDGAAIAGPGPDRAWRAVVEMGLPGMLLSEEPGDGPGTATSRPMANATLAAALAVEELARGLVRAPLMGTLLATALLAPAAAEDPSGRAAEAARALARGERPGSVVLDGDLLAPAAHGIAWDWSDGALVVAVDGPGLAETATTGPAESADPTRGLARTASAVQGPRLGPVEPHHLVRWEALALALLCADLVGTLAGTLDAALVHARTRHQFGRPIGSFQAVQHLAADQHALIEGARSCAWHAAWAVDALGPEEARDAARVAKAFCSEIARPVAEAALQIWGGLGMTWECVAHLYLRRALLDRRALGDEEHHFGVLADRLGAVPAGARASGAGASGAGAC